MQIIKIYNWREIPQNYTGIVEWNTGTKQWFLNGKLHREDGPAVYYASEGSCLWYLNGEFQFQLFPEYQPFIILEETEDKVKILTQEGIKCVKMPQA